MFDLIVFGIGHTNVKFPILMIFFFQVPGIGKVTEKMLKALGIVTCSELYQQRALLSLLFSEASWRNFLDISLGLGSTHLEKYALFLFILSCVYISLTVPLCVLHTVHFKTHFMTKKKLCIL